MSVSDFWLICSEPLCTLPSVVGKLDVRGFRVDRLMLSSLRACLLSKALRISLYSPTILSIRLLFSFIQYQPFLGQSWLASISWFYPGDQEKSGWKMIAYGAIVRSGSRIMIANDGYSDPGPTTECLLVFHSRCVHVAGY